MRDDDCDDDDATRSPTLFDVCGDAIDNDCDGEVDDEANNACGGACTRTLAHEPGTPCSNGLAGACERPGQYVCQSELTVTCDAPSNITPGGELCGDGIDNDCDNQTDEADATDATTWFRDCDADGYAATTDGSVRACTKPADVAGCTWTNRLPVPAVRTNWDCNDSSARYSPAATYTVLGTEETSFDFSCDGIASPQLDDASTACPVQVVNSLNSSAGGVDSLTCQMHVRGSCGVWFGNMQFRTRPEPMTATCPDTGYVVLGSETGGACGRTGETRAFWPCR